jgi:hypothetical protein
MLLIADTEFRDSLAKRLLRRTMLSSARTLVSYPLAELHTVLLAFCYAKRSLRIHAQKYLP